MQRMAARHLGRYAVEETNRTQGANGLSVARARRAKRMDSVFVQTASRFGASAALILPNIVSQNYKCKRPFNFRFSFSLYILV